MSEEQPNLNYVKELAEGDQSFEQKFLEIIKSEFPVEKQTYIDSLEKEDYNATAEIVHKLKHKFNILGLQKGYRLAVGFEEQLKYGNSKLKDDFLRILIIIENYILNI